MLHLAITMIHISSNSVKKSFDFRDIPEGMYFVCKLQINYYKLLYPIDILELIP